MMRVAMDAAGCSAQMADQVRRAMDSRKAPEKLAEIQEQLLAGMRSKGIPDSIAKDIYEKLKAFANFGFAESHAISFAYMVYSSAYVKRYYPAAFYAGLLGAQPMGFYSPQSLVADARRHGLRVLGPDINRSSVRADLEPGAPLVSSTLGRAGESEPVIRLGLESVRHVKRAAAERVVADRDEHGPFADLADVARRTGLSAAALEALAASGAFAEFGLDRRRALWAAGPASTERADRLAHTGVGGAPPPLPAMSGLDQTMADLWSTGISPDRYPTEFWRPQLDALGVVPARDLRQAQHGSTVLVGGIVTHRQRPTTASGITFVNLEDETGMVNVICSAAVWQRHRRIARESGALLIRGRLERADGVVNVVAAQIRKLAITSPIPSRDFR